jgi:hypothetical protein
MDGMLGDERRKSGWMRAEAAGDPDPWRQQAILGRGRWDTDALRDIVGFSHWWNRLPESGQGFLRRGTPARACHPAYGEVGRDGPLHFRPTDAREALSSGIDIRLKKMGWRTEPLSPEVGRFVCTASRFDKWLAGSWSCRREERLVEVYVIGRAAAKARVGPDAIVKVVVAADPGTRFGHGRGRGRVRVEVGFSYSTERQRRCTNTVTRQQPLPSMLIVISSPLSTAAKSTAGEPAPLIGVEDLGLPKRVSASSKASKQKSASSVIGIRQARTRRLNRSTMATRYTKPRAIRI